MATSVEKAPPSFAYPLAASTFSEEEIEAAKAVLDTGRLTMGPRVAAFEKSFAQWVKAPYALMVNSGSSANLLMIEACLRRSMANGVLAVGDEVLVPALTWSTTVWPVMQLGLVPVLVDIDMDTLAIDLASASKALSPKTKALFLVHVLGQIPEMDAIVSFCRNSGLVLIEDVCESLGAWHKGKHAGNFGLMASFSCYFSHHLSTVEGGMITTADEGIFNDLISMRAHGWIRGRSDSADWVRRHPEVDSRFMFVMPGYNVRPMEIQAAMGEIQLTRLDRMLELRTALASFVHGLTQRYAPWLKLVGAKPESIAPDKTRSERHNSWMTLPFMVQKGAPYTARQLQAKFESLGVETRPIIVGNLARQPSAKRFPFTIRTPLTMVDRVFEDGLMIGCHPIDLPRSQSLLEDVFRKLAAPR